MDYSMISTLHQVAYGVAVADIEYGSNLLHVKVLDHLPQMSGDISPSLEMVTARIKTAKGVVEKTAIFCDYVDAYWLNRNSARITAPDIMKGMRLVLWRDGDTGTYYWEELDTDKELKTLEHIIFAISNTNLSDRSNKVLSFENCYIFEFDTRNKKIGLYTNKNDGEPFAYSIRLDTKNGNFHTKDDVGNFWLLDSAKTLIHFENKDKSYYKLDKTHIFEGCTGNKTSVIGGNYIVDVGGNETHTVGGNFHVDAAGVGFKTGNFIAKAGSVGFDSPSSAFSGVVAMAGFSAGGSPSVGAPPKSAVSRNAMIKPFQLPKGYTGIIETSLLVTDSITSPTGNFNTVNADLVDATTGNFAGGNFPI